MDDALIAETDVVHFRAMLEIKQPRQIAVWTVAFMLLAVLSPVVTKTVIESYQLTETVEVCTTTGTQSISITTDHNPSKHDHQAGDCPYCSFSFHSILLDRPSLRSATVDPPLFPDLSYKSPKPFFAWALQPARAPPLSA